MREEAMSKTDCSAKKESNKMLSLSIVQQKAAQRLFM
jgi:hypothetical protein